MALIELDLTAPADPALSSPPPAQRLRIPGLVVTVVLLLALGGAAPAVSVLWNHLGTVPVSGGPESPFQLADGQLYTNTTAKTDRVVTAWSLGTPPRRLWTVTFPARVVGPDQVTFGDVGVESAGDVMLLTDGPATVAVDRATGRTRWSSPVYVEPLPGNRIGLSRTQSFRAGTLYDQDSGAPGPLYFSSTGEPHTEPPTVTEERGVDLHTGAVVWSVKVPGSINVTTAPGEASALLITSADRLTLLSGDTGQVVREVPLPRIEGHGPVGGDLVGDLMVIDYGDWARAHHKVAYSAGTLERRWQRAFPQTLMDPVNCWNVLCSGGRDAPEVLDPATGGLLWRAPADTDLMYQDGLLLESESSTGAQIRLADPLTGAERTDLRGWGADITGVIVAGPVLLRRDEAAGASAFGLVRRDRRGVQMIGVTGPAVSDCNADDRFVVCRAEGGLQIWSYRR